MQNTQTENETQHPHFGSDFAEFLRGYLTAALWSSHNEEEPTEYFDDLDATDSANYEPQTYDVLRSHALSYFSRVWVYAESDENAKPIDSPFEHLGHDFWLDQNRHGAGAEDGHWPKYGALFAGTSRQYPEVNLVLSDAGLVCDGYDYE